MKKKFNLLKNFIYNFDFCYNEEKKSRKYHSYRMNF